MPSRWTSSWRPPRTVNCRCAYSAYASISCTAGSVPGQVSSPSRSSPEPPVHPHAQARDAESPERQVGGGHHRSAGELRPGRGSRSSTRSRRTAHGEVVRRARPSGGAGDDVPDGDAVHRHAAIASPAAPASRGAGGIPAPRPGPSRARASAMPSQAARAGCASRSTAGQPGAVLSRSGLQVADGALLLLRSGRSRSNGRRGRRTGSAPAQRRCAARMALVAGAVRVDRRRVRLDDALGAMARRAVDARRRGGRRGTRCRSRTGASGSRLTGATWHSVQATSACRACSKLDRADRGATAAGTRHRDGDRSCRLDLRGLVARGAVRSWSGAGDGRSGSRAAAGR